MTTSGPIHWVYSHTAIYPACVVASELSVRKRRKNEACAAVCCANQVSSIAVEVFWQVKYAYAANQVFCLLFSRQTFQPSAQFVRNVCAYAVVGDFTIQHPFECFFVFKSLSQHIVHF